MSQLDGFDAFYAAHLDRHRTSAARRGAFIGDCAVAVGGVLLLRRSSRLIGLVVGAAGFAIQLLGHAGHESTVGGELAAAGRHPLWGLVADLRMFRDMARGRLQKAD